MTDKTVGAGFTNERAYNYYKVSTAVSYLNAFIQCEGEHLGATYYKAKKSGVLNFFCQVLLCIQTTSQCSIQGRKLENLQFK